MLENRAFDHMVGFLHLKNPEIDGLKGNETNPYDVNDPTKGMAHVAFNSSYTNEDPGADYLN